jgi:cysteine-rich repeat protein
VIGVLILLASRPPAAYAHGQALPFAFWGDFPSAAARCQEVLAYAATRCANRVWKYHTDCFEALLDGNVCGVSVVVDPVQRAHLDSLNIIDVLCTSPEAQALGFLLKYEAQTDMNNFCYAVENALVSAVYAPVMNGHPPDERTRTCVEATARATTKLWRFAVRARRHALDEVARRSMSPGEKQMQIDASSMRIDNLQALIRKRLEAECATTDFAVTYHHDDGELLTLVAQRADCLAAAVYVQSAVFCPQPVCGNGMQEAGEQCDDGNVVDGDGCSGQCILERPAHAP